MNQNRKLHLFYMITLLLSALLLPCFCPSAAHASANTEDTWFLDDIGAKDAWAVLSGGQHNFSAPTIVAVIDTGCDYSHPLIQSALWNNVAEINGAPGVDDDGNGYVDDFYGIDTYHHNSDPLDDSVSSVRGHGTHVAGCVLQTAGVTETENPFGIQLMILKAGDAYGNFHAADVAEALHYAADNGASVINLSISSQTSPPILEEALEYASQSAILVASSGNRGLPTFDSQFTGSSNFYPAAYPYVAGVMSYGKEHELSSFSNWDSHANSEAEYGIAAPGENILSCTYSGASKTMSGTSMSSGIVSGCAALLAAKYRSPDLYSPKDLTAHLMSCGENDVTFTDSYGKHHTFRRISLQQLLTVPPKPNLVLADCSIEKDKTQPGSYILHYKAANRGCLARNFSISISSDTLDINSNSITQPPQAFPALSCYNGSCSFTVPEGSADNSAQQLSILISYENGANISDTETFSCKKVLSVTLEDDPSFTETVIPLQGITISAPQLLTMKAGSSSKLTVSYIPANTTDDRTLIFHSSNPQIAEIDSDGTIHAQKSGTAKITVTSSKRHTRQFSVLVYNGTGSAPQTPPKTPIPHKPAATQIKKGSVHVIENMQYKVTNADTDGNGTVTLMGTSQKKSSLYSLTVKNTVKIGNVRFQVTAINKKSFKNCKNLKTVKIANSVETIGPECFRGCASLKSITVGTKISKISARAFDGCRKLQKITIKSKKLKSIGKNAFRNIHPKVKVRGTTRLVKLITRR